MPVNTGWNLCALQTVFPCMSGAVCVFTSDALYVPHMREACQNSIFFFFFFLCHISIFLVVCFDTNYDACAL